MGIHWGVDSSFNPSNCELGSRDSRGTFHLLGRYRGLQPSLAWLRDHKPREFDAFTHEPTLYSYVTLRVGRPPEFWGRYIHQSTSITLQESEITYLKAKHCKILPVYSGLTYLRRSRTRGTRANGQQVAVHAINRARAHYSIPSGVRLYADLEDVGVSSEWLRGWLEMIAASSYQGGIYGRPVQVDLGGSAMRVFSRPSLVATALSAYQSPRPQPWVRHAPPQPLGVYPYIRSSMLREPYMVPTADGGRRRLWGEDLCQALTAGPWTCCLWSNEPRRLGDFALDTPGAAMIPPVYAPAEPPGCWGRARAVVWQYRFSCFREQGSEHGLIDMDLATDEGFAAMW